MIHRQHSAALIIMLVTIFSVSLPILGIGYYFLTLVEKDFLQDKTAQANMIRDAVADPIFYVDPAQTGSIARAFLQNRHVAGIKIEDIRGIVFEETRLPWATIKEDTLQTNISYTGEVVGKLTVGFDRETYMKSRSITVERVVLVVALTLVVVLIALSTLLVYRFYRPLVALLHQAEALGSGQIDKNFSWTLYQDEFGNLSKTLEDSRKRLKETQDRVLKQSKIATMGASLAGVAHEISTPSGTALTAASHMEEILIKLALAFQTGQLKKKEFEDHLEELTKLSNMVVYNMERLDSIVSSFRSIVQGGIDTKKRNFKVCHELENLLYSYQSRAKKKGIVMIIECAFEGEMHGFPGRVASIISNLVSNSLKHAFPEGWTEKKRIRIAISGTPGEDLELIYEDNGQGVDQTILERIYEPFSSTHLDARESMGLGMYIVSQNVHAMQGDIQLESEHKHGFKTLIRFPTEMPKAMENE